MSKLNITDLKVGDIMVYAEDHSRWQVTSLPTRADAFVEVEEINYDSDWGTIIEVIDQSSLDDGSWIRDPDAEFYKQLSRLE